jgi:hypothetical protein
MEENCCAIQFNKLTYPREINLEALMLKIIPDLTLYVHHGCKEDDFKEHLTLFSFLLYFLILLVFYKAWLST